MRQPVTLVRWTHPGTGQILRTCGWNGFPDYQSLIGFDDPFPGVVGFDTPQCTRMSLRAGSIRRWCPKPTDLPQCLCRPGQGILVRRGASRASRHGTSQHHLRATSEPRPWEHSTGWDFSRWGGLDGYCQRLPEAGQVNVVVLEYEHGRGVCVCFGELFRHGGQHGGLGKLYFERTDQKVLEGVKRWCPGAESNHRHEDFQSACQSFEISLIGSIVRKKCLETSPFNQLLGIFGAVNNRKV